LSVALPLLIRRSALPRFKPRFAFWPGALPDVVARLQDSRRLPVIGFAYDHHERSLATGAEMRRILKTGVRRVLRNLFGPGIEAFVVDEDWQALLFVPDSR
jgi:hypothetical protein